MKTLILRNENVIALAYVASLCVGALFHTAALWDGGAQILLHIQYHSPWTPHNRWYLYPFNLLIIWFSDAGGEPSQTVQFAGFVYITLLIPFLVFFLKAQINASSKLFVLGGVILSTFPIALFQGIEVLHCFWLVWAAVLALRVYSALRACFALILLSVAAVAHPASMLALVPIIFFESRNKAYHSRLKKGVVVAFLIVLVMWRLYMNTIGATKYEVGEYSLRQLAVQFYHGLLGMPLLLLVAWPLTHFVGASSRSGKPSRLKSIYKISVALACIVYIVQTEQWSTEVEYRKWLPFASVGFLILFYVSEEGHRARLNVNLVNLDLLRFNIIVSIACMLGVAARWNMIWYRLREEMYSTKTVAVSRVEMDWTKNTPLRYWSGTATSLLAQGLRPVAVLYDDAFQGISGYGITIAKGIVVPWESGRIELVGLRGEIIKQERIKERTRP